MGMKSKTSPDEQCQAPAENSSTSALRLEKIGGLGHIEQMCGVSPDRRCSSQAISFDWPILDAQSKGRN
jgi:hypothetical protein